MIRLAPVLVLLLASFASAELAVRDDGKQVELNADGTWQFVSQDVLATSSSGLRVLLAPDGSWRALSPSATSVANAAPSAAYDNAVRLNKVLIQKVKVSRPNAKSAVFEQNLLAQLVFAKLPPENLLQPKYFSLRDSKDKIYPIVAVTARDNKVYVRADGAPDRWSRTQALTLQIDKTLLDTLADISLGVDFREVKTKVYAEFVDE